MLAANFLDMRAIAGEHALCDALRAAILPQAQGREGFVTQLVHNALDNPPPLGVFRRFVLSAGGEHAGMLDLKTALLIPVVDIARIVAVATGSFAVATLDRLRAAAGSEWLSEETAADLGEAFAFAATLRARHQAEQIRRGEAADNWLDPQGLSSLERGHLKAAFALIGDVQQVLQQRLATGT
jgi:CBS domain-containing protein